MSQVAIFNDFDSCRECPCMSYNRRGCKAARKHFNESTMLMIQSGSKGKPGWCPLKPLPEYKMSWNTDENSYENGWNDVLDSIGGR